MRIAILVAIGLAVPLTAVAGTLVGSVVDATGAFIPKVKIRLVREDTRETVVRGEADSRGRFALREVAAGTYLALFASPGFREGTVDSVSVVADGERDLGAVRLDVGGCDAPGAICHDFGIVALNPPPPEPIARGYATLRPGCSLDLASGQMLCLPDPSSGNGFRLAREETGLQVQPAGKTKICVVKSVAGCKEDDFQQTGIRLDGHGPRFELDFRTDNGLYSRVYLVEPVEPGAAYVQIYFVTRSR